MPRVFVGNFDFEHELAGNAVVSRTARAVTDFLAASWLTIAEPGDLLARAIDGRVTYQSLSPLHPRSFTKLEQPAATYCLEPWGWSESMARLAMEQGFQSRHAPLEVVRRVNERPFRYRLEAELQVFLPGSVLLESVSDAERAVAAMTDRWVLKAAFGMAGREQLRGSGLLDDRRRTWVANKLSVGPVVLEPWLDRVDEAGVQFEVPESGVPTFLAVTPQVVDARGTYRGSLFGSAEDQVGWQAAIDIGNAIARRVQAEGYFGPLAIDAMRYRDGDTVRLRPLQDLNARWSMGRLALGLGRHLEAGQCGAWLHLSHEVPQSVRDHVTGLGVSLTPITWESRINRQSVLVAAPDSSLREEAVRALMAH